MEELNLLTPCVSKSFYYSERDASSALRRMNFKYTFTLPTGANITVLVRIGGGISIWSEQRPVTPVCFAVRVTLESRRSISAIFAICAALHL